MKVPIGAVPVLLLVLVPTGATPVELGPRAPLLAAPDGPAAPDAPVAEGTGLAAGPGTRPTPVGAAAPPWFVGPGRPLPPTAGGC